MSSSEEEGEHNVENFMLCSSAHHACSPLLQGSLHQEELCEGSFDMSIFVGLDLPLSGLGAGAFEYDIDSWPHNWVHACGGIDKHVVVSSCVRTTTTTTRTTQAVFPQECHCLRHLRKQLQAVGIMDVHSVQIAASRRRLRRRRQFLRRELLRVAMALAESTHHTAPRGQRRARAGEEENKTNHVPRRQTIPPP